MPVGIVWFGYLSIVKVREVSAGEYVCRGKCGRCDNAVEKEDLV